MGVLPGVIISCPMGHHQPQAAAPPLFAAAVQHHRAGRLSLAEQIYRQVIEIDPAHADSLHLLGMLADQTGRQAAAVALISHAIALASGIAPYHNSLGNAHRGLGDFDAAATCYGRAIALRPDLPEAHNNLGIVFKEQGALDAATACFQRAITLRPDQPEASNNLGTVLMLRGDVIQAATCFRAAVALRPDYAEAHSNLGTALQEQGQTAEAIVCYRQALAHDPHLADAHFGLGTVLLAQGEMPAGWAAYEWRWKTPQMRVRWRHFRQPQWRGEDAANRTLLIHAEQGFGDTLQFCRYAPLAAAAGFRVILEVQQPLVRLLKGLPGVDAVIAQSDALPPFDFHCPLLSMPLAFGTTLATIPSAPTYLQADPARVDEWRGRLVARGEGPRIGLVWAGAPSMKTDARRSLPPSHFGRLLDLPGFQFFSLQKGGSPPMPGVADFMAEMADFADTAALVANLDLVISVDTAVAHLAAGLGKPVWLLDRFDPDWRWLTGRTDSPWYPALRIYRQPQPGDWDSVLAGITRDLIAFKPEG